MSHLCRAYDTGYAAAGSGQEEEVARRAGKASVRTSIPDTVLMPLPGGVPT